MGLFGGGKKAPTMNVDYNRIQSILNQYLSPEAQFSGYSGQMQKYTPEAFGSRESALTDIKTPESTTSYFSRFQPTSIEEALGNQYFQNVYPEAERAIKHGLSLSGIESSPILAAQLGKARGQIGYDVGSFLANQGQQRGQFSLTSRLGVDPFQNFGEYAQSQGQLGMELANLEVSRALADYQNALQKYQSNQQKRGTIGSVIGTALAVAAAPFTGGASLALAPIAASLGGSIGGQSPISMQDALMMSARMSGRGFLKSPTSSPGMYDGSSYSLKGAMGSSNNLYDKLNTPGSPIPVFRRQNT